MKLERTNRLLVAVLLPWSWGCLGHGTVPTRSRPGPKGSGHLEAQDLSTLDKRGRSAGRPASHGSADPREASPGALTAHSRMQPASKTPNRGLRQTNRTEPGRKTHSTATSRAFPQPRPRSERPSAARPRSRPKPSATNFRAIFAVGRKDVWVVGERGTALHWDGRAWRVVPTGTCDALTGLWASGPRDVWATGQAGRLHHWDGGTWTQLQVVSNPGAPNLNAVCGTGSKNVWVVGDRGAVVHWDGNTWRPVPCPTRTSLRSVWCPNEKEVWVGGDDGTLLRLQGGSWQKLGQQAAITQQASFTSIWGASPRNVWVAQGEVAVAHWDGRRWNPHFLDRVNQDVPEHAFWALSGSGPKDVWAVGSSGALRHWTGRRWHKKDVPLDVTLNAVAVLDRRHAWAVGDLGTVLAWNGHRWRKVLPKGQTRRLHSTMGTRPTGLWALGDDSARGRVSRALSRARPSGPH